MATIRRDVHGNEKSVCLQAKRVVLQYYYKPAERRLSKTVLIYYRV